MVAQKTPAPFSWNVPKMAPDKGLRKLTIHIEQMLKVFVKKPFLA